MQQAAKDVNRSKREQETPQFDEMVKIVASEKKQAFLAQKGKDNRNIGDNLNNM